MAKIKNESKTGTSKRNKDMGPGMMTPKDMPVPMHDEPMTKLMRDHKKKHHSNPDKMGEC